MRQLKKIFRDNEKIEEVLLIEESKSGIGSNLYADYTTTEGEPVRIDISDYASW